MMVMMTVTTCLQALDQDFFAKCFNALASRWDNSLDKVGDYIEK
jgi:hypothetical protein